MLARFWLKVRHPRFITSCFKTIYIGVIKYCQRSTIHFPISTKTSRICVSRIHGGDWNLHYEDVLQNWSPYAKEYDPLKAGSIDGTDTEPHDKAISRAIQTHYEPPRAKSKPSRTLFVARFGPRATKHDLREFFSRYGEVVSAKVIVDVVTGLSQGYGFVEMRSEDEVRRAIRRGNNAILNEHKVFVDHECGRTMKGWKPRRLGGGFGGKKESGQLRFGGTDRPFKRPIIPEIIK